MTQYTLTGADLFAGQRHCEIKLSRKMRSLSTEIRKDKIDESYCQLVNHICETLGRNNASYPTKEAIIAEIKKHHVTVKTRIDHIIDKILKIRYKVDRNALYELGGFLQPPK